MIGLLFVAAVEGVAIWGIYEGHAVTSAAFAAVTR